MSPRRPAGVAATSLMPRAPSMRHPAAQYMRRSPIASRKEGENLSAEQLEATIAELEQTLQREADGVHAEARDLRDQIDDIKQQHAAVRP
jgi:hypothetical protein